MHRISPPKFWYVYVPVPVHVPGNCQTHHTHRLPFPVKSGQLPGLSGMEGHSFRFRSSLFFNRNPSILDRKIRAVGQKVPVFRKVLRENGTIKKIPEIAIVLSNCPENDLAFGHHGHHFRFFRKVLRENGTIKKIPEIVKMVSMVPGPVLLILPKSPVTARSCARSCSGNCQMACDHRFLTGP